MGSGGHPSGRYVSLRHVDQDGFVFHSDYNSRKGSHMDKNPKVSGTFYWPTTKKQVRIEGVVEKTGDDENDAEFDRVGLMTQASRVLSHQGKKLKSKEHYIQEVEALTKKLEEKGSAHLERTENLGGYRIKPHLIEFWQGRSSRIHDRLEYKLKDDGSWATQMLYP